MTIFVRKKKKLFRIFFFISFISAFHDSRILCEINQMAVVHSM